MILVGIIDYGLGNLGSLLNMCRKIDSSARIVDTAEAILASSHLILPGVGTFDTGMVNLESRGLIPVLENAVVNQKIPILGICLGAQLMLERSEEGKLNGLGWINGKVLKFNLDDDLKVPHMGWNTLIDIKDTGLFLSMPQDPPRFYFVHSYYLSPQNPDYISSNCVYGKKFAASFQTQNISGVQFHPEKSHKFGMQLLKNFLK